MLLPKQVTVMFGMAQNGIMLVRFVDLRDLLGRSVLLDHKAPPALRDHKVQRQLCLDLQVLRDHKDLQATQVHKDLQATQVHKGFKGFKARLDLLDLQDRLDLLGYLKLTLKS